MSEIIVHAGTHKTATTTIQQTLHQNRLLLAEQGVVYPEIGRGQAHHALAAEWLDHLEPYRDAPPLDHWAALAEEYGASAASVILSSEAFSRKAPKQVDLQALRARTARFSSRRIVYVLRNQLAYIQSLYLEAQRKHRMPPFGEYVRRCLARERAAGMYLNYGELYADALAAFAPTEVVLLSYEALARSQRSITAAFLSVLGLRDAAASLRPLPGTGRLNRSPEPLAAWAANQVTAPDIADDHLVGLASEVLREAFGDTVATTLFSRGEIERIQAHFEPMNRALEARYRAMDPTFAIAPLRLPDNLLHRDELGSAFWRKLARRLYRAGVAPARGCAPA